MTYFLKKHLCRSCKTILKQPGYKQINISQIINYIILTEEDSIVAISEPLAE